MRLFSPATAAAAASFAVHRPQNGRASGETAERSLSGCHQWRDTGLSIRFDVVQSTGRDDARGGSTTKRGGAIAVGTWVVSHRRGADSGFRDGRHLTGGMRRLPRERRESLAVGCAERGGGATMRGGELTSEWWWR